MVVLAVFTLRDVPTDSAPAALPFVAAGTVTVGLHLWRHNALVSILAGTAVRVAPAHRPRRRLSLTGPRSSGPVRWRRRRA